MKKVACLMSGGVDSAVACAMLQKQGFEVIGFTLKLWNNDSRCCNVQDIYDARRISIKLNIPHYLINLQKEFKEDVINYFVSEYINGRTPNPCVVCNQKIKFGKFVEKTSNLNIDFIATGHYASICNVNNRYILKKSKSLLKDQSYFLAQLSQNALSKIIFPLAELKKTAVKQKATELKLNLELKKESQEICFIPDNDRVKFINNFQKVKPGNIIDKNDKIIGCHPGIIKYTIGQRKGIKLASQNPLYVVGIDADKNNVIVGRDSDLYTKDMVVTGLNWISIEKLDSPMLVDVKIRYNQVPINAEILPSNGDVLVRFYSPQRAVTPGQLAVFYKDDTVVGSGWIEKI